MNKFWRWVKNKTPTVTNDGGAQGEGRTLFLDGPISDEKWWGDEVTPKAFRDELFSDSGDVTVWINSPGGSVFAADQIYNMLRDYSGHVTVKIDAIAASAASIIAMAGDEVLISPVATMMIHNPATIAIGNVDDLEKAIQMLTAIKECILNAYMLKTGMSHKKLSDMMDAETFLDAKECVSLGFADAMIERVTEQSAEPDPGQPEEAEGGKAEEAAAEEAEEPAAEEKPGSADASKLQKASLLFAGMAFSTDRVEKITAYCTGQMPKPEPAAKKEDLLNRLNLLRRAF